VTVAAKLAGFATGLAVLFGGAALAGSAVGPLHDEPRATAETGDGMRMGAGDDAGERATPQAVRGLAVTDDGLTLRLDRTSAPRGRRFDLAFRIVDRGGRTVRAFDVEHTRRMHLIVVRRDMTGFQHLHPTQRDDGSWSAPVALRHAGSYRVFADFSSGGEPHTLAADVTVDGTVRSHELLAPAPSTTVDGLKVRLTQGATQAGAESGLAFTVTRNGRPVAVEDYLGAKGHLVALRQGDLAFLHVHPDENRLRFMAEFPTAASYRLFLQFKTDGRLHTAAFTQEVAR
jgi:hypothetical protein